MARNSANNFLVGMIGGYGLGRRMKEDRARDAMEKELAGINDVTQTEVASGEDALAAARRAREIALAGATDDAQRQQIEAGYAPTLTALEAEQSRPASTVQTFGVGQNFNQVADKAALPAAQIAAREGVYRRFGKDEEADRLQDRAMNREATQLNIDAAKNAKEARDRLTRVDGATSAYTKSLLQGADGSTRQLTPEDIDSIDMFRQGALFQQGAFSEARELGDKMIVRRTAVLKANEAERKSDAAAAALAWSKGDPKPVMTLYNKHALNNEDVIDAKSDGKGNVALVLKDKVTGQTYSQTIKEDQIPRIIEIMGGDAGTLAQIEQRSFAERMALNADRRASSAEARAAQAHELALPAAKVAAALGTAQIAYSKETDPAKKAALLEEINSLQATGGVGKDAPAEVKLANAFRRAGLAKTDAEALKMATTTKDMSPEKMRFELAKSFSQGGTMPAADVKKAVDEIMASLGAAESGGAKSGPVRIIGKLPNEAPLRPITPPR